MKIDWAYAPGWTAKSLPLTPTRVNKALRGIQKALRDLPEWAETTAVLGHPPRDLAVLICGDEEMRVYNRDYRKLDRTTDVLSFPTRELALPASSLGEEAGLGDLIVSLPAIARGARRGRRPVADEFLEVLVHGILHLLGFDHIVPKVSAAQARRMRSEQRALFAAARRAMKT